VFGTDKVLGNTTLYAKWTPINYTVSFVVNNGIEIEGKQADYDTVITAPTVPTKENYTFAGWYKEAQLTNLWVFGTDKVLGDTTLYAKWNPINYTVSFVVNNGTEIEGKQAAYDTVITAPTVPTKENYTFEGWYKEDLETLWVFGSDKLLGDMTLYAKWTPVMYIVNFQSNGGDLVTKVNAAYDTIITAPTTPTKPNYTFAGWYKEAAATTLWSFDSEKVQGDMILYAKWTPNTYIVNFNANGGSLVSKVNADYDSTITVPPNPTKANYTFAGWYKETSFTTLWHFGTDKVLGDTMLYAKWLSTSATISSYLGQVSTGGTAIETVTNITYGTTLDALKAAITPAANATYQIYEADGHTEATTLVTGCVIIVTAEDGVTRVTYTVIVNAPLSSNAMLSSLYMVQGEFATELPPSQLAHTVIVPTNISSLTLFFTKADPTETIVVTGAVYSTVTNDVYSYVVPSLLVGMNGIQIKVIAQDGTTNNYEIYVNREPAKLNELIDVNQDGVLDILDVMMIISSSVSLRQQDVEELLSQISPQLR
ncbi:InlB B-repeat-containing protein, partial [Paenibacillus sp. 2RAB27]|uniref:InlB B-repeat-containing protein n=1 Tax=Paenibacillus sp. 2RAB27 TaxID=3232991 RepID=UPI003F9AAFD7